MSDFSSLKTKLGQIMAKMDDCGCQDATGDEQSKVDYNFDILKEPFIGTDFEEDAGMLCNVAKGFNSRAGSDHLKSMVVVLRNAFDDGYGNAPEVEHYVKFLTGLDGMLNGINKAIAASSPPVPSFDQNMATPNLVQDVPKPNFSNAQAKLLELEKYKESLGIDNEKWNKYLDEARRKAAIGSDDFTPTPELDMEDMNDLREKARAEQKKLYTPNYQAGVKNE